MPSRSLSSLERASSFRELSTTRWDLLVIGGGITGAGIALDAASRGLNTALVEMQDFSAGTSSRSTKLIHGGLRYLKNFEPGMVRETGKERTILRRNAPHLVFPQKMLLPIIRNGSLGYLSTKAALTCYDVLISSGKEERHRMLSASETMRCEPLLDEKLVKGGALYHEYQTNDARLVIEILKTAASLGALCINYAEAAKLLYEEGKVHGASVRDAFSGKVHAVRSGYVVNAAGPWVDDIRSKDGSLSGKRLHLTKGVHLVVPYPRLPLKTPVYFDTPFGDGRMVFAIPRQNATYIGTTDTDFSGDRTAPAVSREDAEYLVRTVNHLFPSAGLSLKDICSSWSGVRPLIHQEAKSPSEISRKDELFASPSGLISIAGGKLSGYRKMSEKAVDLIMKRMSDRPYAPSRTTAISLSGGAFSSADDRIQFGKDLAKRYVSLGFKAEEVLHLTERYGSNAEIILKKARSEEDLLLEEIHYSVSQEGATGLCDYFIRRTQSLAFRRMDVPGMMEKVLPAMSAALGWDEEIRKSQLSGLEKEVHSAINFI